MTSIAVFLRRFGNFLRLLFRRQTLNTAYGKLLGLAVYLKRLLDRARSRTSTSGSPSISDRPNHSDDHVQFLPNTETVICTSQVPPNISYPPDSPIRTMSEARTRHSPTIPIRPNSEYLHPYSNILTGHENETIRPYARSEPAMSLHRVSSRAPSQISTRSRSSSQKETRPSSPTRSIRRSHVSTGITTPARTSITLPAGEGPSESNDVASTINESSAESRTMHPIVSTERYDRDVVIPRRTEDAKVLLQPVTLDFQLPGIPPDWTACHHPEGALYFFNESKKTYTDAHLCDPEVAHEIELFQTQLWSHIHDNHIVIPEDSELVLDLVPGSNVKYAWCYYFVDHRTRSLFWVHEFDMSDHTYELLGYPELPLLHFELQRYYWYAKASSWIHWETFPHGHELPSGVVEEIMGILLHALTDQLTSPTSTILYSCEDLERMLNVARNARNLPSSVFSTCVITRYLGLFIHAWFLNYHGQHGARLNRDDSVHGQRKYPRSSLIRTLAPLLFNAPMVHLRALEKIWVDRCMCHHPWAVFIEKLKSEWEEFILYGTVLLNANVAFLAVPGVNAGDGTRTPAQVTSYISIVTSVGSILIGLLLVRQYRVRPRDTVEEAATFLNKKTHATRGIEILAILYSLPYALLLWAMVTFLGAFSIECFTTNNRNALWISASAWVLVAFLIVWVIYSAWEDSPTPVWKRVLNALERGVDRVRERNRTMLARLLRVPPVDPC
ncbi:hypothetical protein QCA50_020239 [Cerrena zonata]|uniref:WW domain-containing protein n=1 Tax=Cerrena zonata TaxID=2478898 RepID=A0AAW0FHI7_9APHY